MTDHDPPILKHGCDSYPPERAAQYETLIERSSPAPADCRCTCTLCVYGTRAPLSLRCPVEDAA
jgi:hypothetical protein